MFQKERTLHTHWNKQIGKKDGMRIAVEKINVCNQIYLLS